MAGVRLPQQNQVLITGRLTHDPEVSFTGGGAARCRFSVAVNQRYKDKTSGEWKDLVNYIPVVVWREAAQRCKDKLRKGSPVHVEGRLRSAKYEDKATGQTRTSLNVEASKVQFLEMIGEEGRPEPRVGASEGAGDAASPVAESEMEEVPF